MSHCGNVLYEQKKDNDGNPSVDRSVAGPDTGLGYGRSLGRLIKARVWSLAYTIRVYRSACEMRSILQSAIAMGNSTDSVPSNATSPGDDARPNLDLTLIGLFAILVASLIGSLPPLTFNMRSPATWRVSTPAGCFADLE